MSFCNVPSVTLNSTNKNISQIRTKVFSVCYQISSYRIKCEMKRKSERMFFLYKQKRRLSSEYYVELLQSILMVYFTSF